MLDKAERRALLLSSRIASRMLVPFQWISGLLTVGALVVLFEIIGLVNRWFPEDEELEGWD